MTFEDIMERAIEMKVQSEEPVLIVMNDESKEKILAEIEPHLRFPARTPTSSLWGIPVLVSPYHLGEPAILPQSLFESQGLTWPEAKTWVAQDEVLGEREKRLKVSPSPFEKQFFGTTPSGHRYVVGEIHDCEDPECPARSPQRMSPRRQKGRLNRGLGRKPPRETG